MQPTNEVLGKDLKALAMHPVKDRLELLGPWLREGTLIMVYGWRGVGKTYFLLAVAWALASLSNFLGFTPPKRRRICWIDGEMGYDNLKPRLNQIDACFDDSPPVDSIRIVSFEDTGGVIWNLSEPQDQERYSKLLDSHDLMILDNLSSCVRRRPKETELDAWNRVQPWLIKERSRGKTILLIHHAGKSGQQRGISDREDILDTVLALRKPSWFMPKTGEDFEIHFEKTRYFFGADAEPLWVNMVPDGKGIRFETKALKDKRIDVFHYMRNLGVSLSDCATTLGLTYGHVKSLEGKYGHMEGDGAGGKGLVCTGEDASNGVVRERLGAAQMSFSKKIRGSSDEVPRSYRRRKATSQSSGEPYDF